MLPLLGLTLFVSAFLLFCCEPMVGKMVLPILGGAASVWTTCVLFFQIMLLAGYVYTHFIAKLRRVRDQILIHASLMLIALTFLPIRFSGISGHPSETPVTWLLGHLLITVGIPFGVIAATAPLLQHWLARTPAAAGRDPYFLYATSNAGSLLALLAYPVLVEPRYGVSVQSRLWLQGYGLLFALVSFAAALIWKESTHIKGGASAEPGQSAAAPDWKTRGYWLAAAFVPSALMLAVTNHISLNIGSVPFLWVIPLAAYLLTFIMAFARKIRLSTMIVSSVATFVLLVLFPIAAVGVPVPASQIWKLTAGHIAILFFASLLCHSSLADRRPPATYLTEFYFIVALGGAIGGIFTAIVAPALFKTVFEYPLLLAMAAFFRKPRGASTGSFGWKDAVSLAGFGLMLAAAIFAIVGWAGIDVTEFGLSWDALKANDNITIAFVEIALILAALLFRKRVVSFGLAFSILIVTYAIVLPREFEGATRLFVARDFFGVKKVLYDRSENMRKLLHGDTMHGVESLDVALAGQPLSYYHKTGPIGDVMEMLNARPRQHVAVVGLGTGTIAAYGGPSRQITFFDVDPQVVDIARNFFTFVRRCGDDCNIIVGDGRLSIQAQPDREFDLIVLDAFNSDSIPAHLVSREAVRMYMSKLKTGGVLLFHVSNRYLNVEKLATVVALDEGLPAFVRHDEDEGPAGKAASDYVAAVRRPEDLANIPNKDSWEQVPKPTEIQAWTDDYSNMMSVIRWK